MRILAQSPYNADSEFAGRLAAHADRILPTLIQDANSDVPTIRLGTLWYIAEILHVFKPRSLKPEAAGQLLTLLSNSAALQEPNSDVRIRSNRLLWELADVNGDRKVDCADVAVVRGAIGTKVGGAGFDPRADINMDGIVDEKDLAYVTARLPNGVACSGAR